MSFRRRLSVLLIVIWGLLMTASAVRGDASLDRMWLLELLRDRNFAVLEQRFEWLQSKVEGGIVDDRALARALDAFTNTSIDLAAPLDAWIVASPDSGFAAVARARYFTQIASHIRGHARLDQLSKKTLIDLKAFSKAAISDLSAATNQNILPQIAYASLIDAYRLQDDFDQIQMALDRGIEHFEASIVLRHRYLLSLLPRDGRQDHRDVLAEIERAAHRIGTRPDQRPEFRSLWLFPVFARGVIAWQKGEFDEARSLFAWARRGGVEPDASIYEARANLAMGRTRDALNSIDAALLNAPQRPEALALRAEINSALGRTSQAMADQELVQSLDPDNPDFLLSSATSLRNSRRFGEALHALDRAAFYGAGRIDVREARGKLNLYDRKSPVSAIADLAVVVELDPIETRHWYNLGMALYQSKNCQARRAFEEYMMLCKNGGSCGVKKRKWVTDALGPLRKYCRL